MLPTSVLVPVPLILEARRWYIVEITYPNGDRHVSPVLIRALAPMGGGRLEVEFFHAEYPAGVQEKLYVIHVRVRAAGYLLATLRDEPDGPPRLVLFVALTPTSLARARPDLRFASDADLPTELARLYQPR